MRVLVAPDSFKGSLGSGEVAQGISRGVLRAWPQAQVTRCPLADGGEGTVEALREALGGEMVYLEVTGPLGDPVRAAYLLSGDTAVVEMAQASGLPLVEGRVDPLRATSHGTGELLLDACRRASRIILGVGGSASVDGGTGALRALGLRFLDDRGQELEPGGGSLRFLARVETEGLDPIVLGKEIRVAADVSNSLLGPEGAAPVFGPQKGADPEQVRILEEGLALLAQLTLKTIGRDISQLQHGGAAGGLAGGLWAYLGAELVPGSDLILDLVGFDSLLEGSDLVITGEGALDRTTWSGKVVEAVVRRCGKEGVPVAALSGSVLAPEMALERGLWAWGTIVPGPTTLQESREHAISWVEEASWRHLRWARLGQALGEKGEG